MMNITDKGIELIKSFEGLSLKAFKPKQWKERYFTIGYGHYGADVKEGQTITEQQAEELLKKDVKTAVDYVNICIGDLALRQTQFDALVSFCYNVGTYNFFKSTLLKKVKEDPWDKTIADEFQRWVYASGKKLPGLVNRRKEEARLYFSL